MKESMTRTKLIAMLAITALLVIIGVLNLRDRLGPNAVPTDGITWEETAAGLRVKAVNVDSPLTWRVKKGDLLRAIYLVSKRSPNEPPQPLEYAEIKRIDELQLYLDRQGVRGDARYAIENQAAILQIIHQRQPPVFDVDVQ